MTNGQSSVNPTRSGTKAGSTYTLGQLRVRAVARRRIARGQTAKWVGNRSRRKKIHTLAVCVGTLLLMAIGLYFGLSRQEATGPVESVAPMAAVVIVSAS
jgi:hypothetical protein